VLAYAPAEFLRILPGPTSTVPLGILGAGLFIRGHCGWNPAPGANWRQAMADTYGHAWEIFRIIVGATLPFVIVAAVAGGSSEPQSLAMP